MSIKIENASYVYNKGMSIETLALDNINLKIEKGEFVGIIGHTGSGKSTLIQLFNGLEFPTKGNVYYNEKNIQDSDFDLQTLRKSVGLVFQYPEHQLFEETVLRDVCFGPLNLGMNMEDAKERAKEALKFVGANEDIYYKSPFELSGGQKRRVAIAGILAMKPDILVLDEPTAGLDPKGRDMLLDLLANLNREHGYGIVLVSHSMDDIAKYADRIIVMDNAKIAFDDSPTKVFKNYKELEKMGLAAPQMTYVLKKLKESGLRLDTSAMTVEGARNAILNCSQLKIRDDI